MVNRQIIVATVILMAAGAYRVLVTRQHAPNQTGQVTLVRIIVGGYILALVASVIDLVGGPASAAAGLLMLLAVLTALLAILPDLFQRLALQRKGA